jgi:hypothetical protein
MGAKQIFIDKLVKLNTQGLSGDVADRSRDDAEKEAEAISNFMLGMKVPTGALCIDVVPKIGTPNAGLIKLIDPGGSTIALAAALAAINGAGATAGIAGIASWSKDYAKAVSEFCLSVGLAANSFIVDVSGPGVGVPNPPIPIADLGGSVAKFQADYVKVKSSGATDPKALAGITPWASQISSAITTFVMTLIVPPAVGFASVANPAPPPPVAGVPNPTPLSLSDS